LERIGNILDVILNPAVVQEAELYSRLYKAWNDIVDEAFTSGYQSENEEIEGTGDFIFNDTEMRNRVNAVKLHDHSKIRELDRQRLIVEADHPGWIQILQYKQRQLLAAVQRKFPSLEVKKLSFILMRR
jgi:hypothetical protein